MPKNIPEPNNVALFELIKKHHPGFDWRIRKSDRGGVERTWVEFTNYPTTGANPSLPVAGEQVPLSTLAEHFQAIEDGKKTLLVLDDPNVQAEALVRCARRRSILRREKRKGSTGRSHRLSYGF